MREAAEAGDDLAVHGGPLEVVGVAGLRAERQAEVLVGQIPECAKGR